MFDFLIGLGVLGVIIGVLIIVFVPLILTIIVGINLANYFGFTGFAWWTFVILFYLIVGCILSKSSK